MAALLARIALVLVTLYGRDKQQLSIRGFRTAYPTVAPLTITHVRSDYYFTQWRKGQPRARGGKSTHSDIALPLKTLLLKVEIMFIGHHLFQCSPLC